MMLNPPTEELFCADARRIECAARIVTVDELIVGKIEKKSAMTRRVVLAFAG